ncbi:hypothetical protein K1T71_001126 [Dendrolimus kikuchii]|uniref:Uncharacterized protein n=1 Tax=Dendrolimus kikuchii TaxID=765133 RepID=A0ACC1DGW5_9NEOP|nr:hypothetical protein K1T71_001126 [Dendrolimus kikuchii]
MKLIVTLLVLCVVDNVRGIKYVNQTLPPDLTQLSDYRLKSRNPDIWTTIAGEPIDIRNIISINSDVFSNQLNIDTNLNFDAERIPERVVHAKGTVAIGYFEVTNDVSKYTSADVFNSIGKITPLIVRFSSSTPSLGGPDAMNDLKGMAVKFYTKDGNLDLLCLQTPVYPYTDPLFFNSFIHAFKKNPKTNFFDSTARWDLATLRPTVLNVILWVAADYGIPNGYRKMDGFPIHTYELSNKQGETHYVRFNFRTEQGLDNLTVAQAVDINGRDVDYYNRDLYRAIARKDYPVWRLEMDVLTKEDLRQVGYNPFDVTRLWKNGTYSTVQIGRLVLNENPDNMFRVSELSAFNPGHLVPGIPGPVDFLFKGRRINYRDTQNYRLGRNHNKIPINLPRFAKTYVRDGKPPVRDNMGDAPNYFPNSFNGPIPYVDETRPRHKLLVLESNAVDLEPMSYFYNYVLTNDAQRQRLIDNLSVFLASVSSPVLERSLNLLALVDKDLGTRVAQGLKALLIARTTDTAT